MGSGLTLHKDIQLGIATIHSLSNGSAAELEAALESADLAAHAEALAERVALKVNAIPRSDVDKIVEALSRLCQISTGADVPPDEFVDDVYEVMGESKEYGLQLSPEGQQAFKERLKSLLSTKAVNVVAKARLVFIEHEHYFCYARIMTDIRPIFGERVQDKPSAATIVHSLKIAYHKGSEVRELFVALDEAGLDRLGELIDRARTKADSLKSVLKAADIRYIDMELD